jgi:hypothetical protein
MSDAQLGKLLRVDPRTVWSDEARHFTPWLAKNLPLLNQAVGLEIELTGTEIAVGNFAVDIYGKEASTGLEVVIENQLAPTDHTHLGQLLTYAAGLDAKIIVWISPQVRDEHRQAVEWLNRQTPETISFFAVELELLQIDGSSPAANFKVVAQPSEFQRGVASESLQKRSRRELAYRAFFSALVQRINELHPGFTNVKSVGYQSWVSLGTGKTGIGLNVAVVRPNILRVEMYISTGDREKNQRWLEELREKSPEIEEAIGQSLAWEQLPKDCRISLTYSKPVDPEQSQEDAIDWAAREAIHYREVFGPLIRSLSSDRDDVAEMT